MLYASQVLMVRPAAFQFNEETAATNFFQSKPTLTNLDIQGKALEEFDHMVDVLRLNGIDVLVIEDTAIPVKPDAIFPNNWLATMPGGILAVFPMQSPLRRLEKRDDIIDLINQEFEVKEFQDWSEFETSGKFLEGTGSMMIDHTHHMIYACASERTHTSVLEKFASANKMQAIIFLASDKNGQPIYHTNVMMALGNGFCVLCEEAIDEEWEQIAVRQLLESSGFEIIRITKEQMHSFAGNMLQLRNKNNEMILVMSDTAFQSLTSAQITALKKFTSILSIPVRTIEKVEGGSVRCMMAEIFLDKKNQGKI